MIFVIYLLALVGVRGGWGGDLLCMYEYTFRAWVTSNILLKSISQNRQKEHSYNQYEAGTKSMIFKDFYQTY